ncbi:hypothetical protein BJ912DRAFT_298912 [Pholiota molesta]|nr:hypothetical protein BJ912DRAFT_298912 [Pholiota molesta]
MSLLAFSSRSSSSSRTLTIRALHMTLGGWRRGCWNGINGWAARSSRSVRAYRNGSTIIGDPSRYSTVRLLRLRGSSKPDLAIVRGCAFPGINSSQLLLYSRKGKYGPVYHEPDFITSLYVDPSRGVHLRELRETLGAESIAIITDRAPFRTVFEAANEDWLSPMAVWDLTKQCTRRSGFLNIAYPKARKQSDSSESLSISLSRSSSPS